MSTKFPYCEGIGRGLNRLMQERLERLKKERPTYEETSYAGLRILKGHLSPCPEDSEQRSKRKYL